MTPEVADQYTASHKSKSYDYELTLEIKRADHIEPIVYKTHIPVTFWSRWNELKILSEIIKIIRMSE